MAVQIPLEAIEEDGAPVAGRGVADDAALSALRESIAAHGVLEPIVVARQGNRFRVLAGRRRIRAAAQAGLRAVPALVRDAAETADLRPEARREPGPAERVRLVAELADGGLGVRAIARRMGIAPATASKWLRIARRPLLLRALDEGRLDVFRAMELVQFTEIGTVEQLITEAPEMAQREFGRLVRATLKRQQADASVQRLAAMRRELASVRLVTPAVLSELRELYAAVVALMAHASAAEESFETSAGRIEAEPEASEQSAVAPRRTPAIRAPTARRRLSSRLGDERPARVSFGEPGYPPSSRAKAPATREAHAEEMVYAGRRYRIGTLEVCSIHVRRGEQETALHPVDPDPAVLFDFGRPGPGTLLLARSLMAHLLGCERLEEVPGVTSEQLAARLSRIEGDEWSLTETVLRAWCASLDPAVPLPATPLAAAPSPPA